MKIVLNKCYGGFSLSKNACDYLGIDWNANQYKYTDHEKRTDPKLIKCIENLGSEVASGELAELEVIEIPDDIEWEIEDYDGIEHVSEKHRTW